MTTCVYDFVQHSKDPNDTVKVLRIYPEGGNPNHCLRIFNHDGRLVINDFVIDLAGEEMIREMMNGGGK